VGKKIGVGIGGCVFLLAAFKVSDGIWDRFGAPVILLETEAAQRLLKTEAAQKRAQWYMDRGMEMDVNPVKLDRKDTWQGERKEEEDEDYHESV
jgi:hypothetical protein